MTAQADKKARTELLKHLREAHGETFSRTQDLLKEQKHLQQEISKVITGQAKTVPEVAAATGAPGHEVLWWLASMKKYGLVVEDGMQEDYPLYKLVEVQK